MSLLATLQHISGSVQDCGNSIAYALELQQSCSFKLSILHTLVLGQSSLGSGWYWATAQSHQHIEARQNGCHLTDNIFKLILLNENDNVDVLIKISKKFVPSGPFSNIPSLVQIMAWRRSGVKPLSEPMMVNLLMHIYASLGLNELTIHL